MFQIYANPLPSIEHIFKYYTFLFSNPNLEYIKNHPKIMKLFHFKIPTSNLKRILESLYSWSDLIPLFHDSDFLKELIMVHHEKKSGLLKNKQNSNYKT
jgi:hypothetical protein